MAKLLKDELRKKKEKANREALEINKIIDDTNQLLLGDHQEDAETKRALGIHSKVTYENEITETTHRLAMHDKIYKKESFSGAFIKELCNKYDLRILPISSYTGKVPPEMYKEIRKFGEDNKDKKVQISDSNFFILAPVEMFETRKVRKILDKDPIVFYRENQNGTYSRTVTQKDVLMNVYDWGNDFSLLRRLRYLVNDYCEYSNDGISNKTRTLLFTGAFLLLAILHLTGAIESFGLTMILAILMALAFIGGTLTENKIEDLWNKDIK